MVTARSPEARVDNGLAAICALAWAAALIHVQAAIGHFAEAPLVAVLFALLAAAQFAWGIAVYRLRSPALLWAGAAVSVLVAAAWAMSRITGIPIGEDPWVPEPVGLIDVLATLDELALAAAVVVRTRGSQSRAARRAVGAAAVALLLMSSLSLAGLSGHVH